MGVDAKIDHDHILNAFRQSAAEAIIYRQNELLLDKRFVAAAEQAILSHNLLTNKISNTLTKLLCLALMLQNGPKLLIRNSMSYNDLKRGIE